MASPRRRSVVTAGLGEGDRGTGAAGGYCRVFPKPDLLGSGLVGADYMVRVLGCSIVSDSLQTHGL